MIPNLSSRVEDSQTICTKSNEQNSLGAGQGRVRGRDVATRKLQILGPGSNSASARWDRTGPQGRCQGNRRWRARHRL